MSEAIECVTIRVLSDKSIIQIYVGNFYCRPFAREPLPTHVIFKITGCNNGLYNRLASNNIYIG